MNIVTVVNSQYMPFAEVFFNSLTEISDYEKIDRVFVIDTGINKNDQKKLSQLCNKLVICQTNTAVPNAALHTEKWREIVGMKLRSLLRIIKVTDHIYPLCMIDIDSYFNKNFLHEVDTDVDFVVCKRSTPMINNDNYVLTHIGSFFCVNNRTAVKFLDSWMREMNDIQGDHIETPALCNLLKNIEKHDKFKIQHAEQDIVSAVNFTEKCCIFHLKSDGPGLGSSTEYRLNKLKPHLAGRHV